MCGIIGEVNRDRIVNIKLFEKMRDTLAHRGPDAAGIQILENGKTALGHRRLSIIDLSDSGKQPMTNEDGTIWITFNGEIYNYLEIRKILIDRGHKFLSNSDTEVIIHGYEEWGIDIVNKLKGMFAFGLWDSNEKNLYLVRDRFGMKPLYYYMHNDRLLFASEIKAIIEDRSVPRAIDFDAAKDFLVYRYIPSPKSIWKGIRKISPASYLKFSMATSDISIHEYWKLEPSENGISEKEAVDKVNELMYNSVREHLVSDVPVGLFLSGGLDSSGLAYYAKQLNYSLDSYSIGFKDWHLSEHEYAKTIADHLKLNHHEIILDNTSIDLTEKLTYFFDEPFAASSMIPGYMISEIASKQLKVVLAGDGGDELFGGYGWYYKSHQNYEHERKKFFKNIFNSFRSNDRKMEFFQKFNNWGLENKSAILKIFNQEILNELQRDDFWFFSKFNSPSLSIVKNAQFIDTHTFLPEACNTRADRCGMANSIEVRVPFQDHKLFEYVMSLKESVYFDQKPKKKLLYNNICQHLPRKVLDKNKKGFSSPLSRYLDLAHNRNEIMNGELVKANWIDKKGLLELLDIKDPVFSWGIFLLDKWYTMWK